MENVEANSTGGESITTRIMENVEFVENFPVRDCRGRWRAALVSSLSLLIARYRVIHGGGAVHCGDYAVGIVRAPIETGQGEELPAVSL